MKLRFDYLINDNNWQCHQLGQVTNVNSADLMSSVYYSSFLPKMHALFGWQTLLHTRYLPLYLESFWSYKFSFTTSKMDVISTFSTSLHRKSIDLLFWYMSDILFFKLEFLFDKFHEIAVMKNLTRRPRKHLHSGSFLGIISKFHL